MRTPQRFAPAHIRIGLAISLALSACALVKADESAARTQAAAAKQRELHLPDPPYHYTDDALPPHFTTRQAKSYDTTPADNPTTDAGATLGRVLFYDTRLSANQTVSCGSCHEQKHAFTDARRF